MLKYPKFILFTVLAFISFSSFAKKIKDKNTLKVSYYNLENLYDTIPNSEEKFDEDYTPNGSKNWNTQKYTSKINNCAIAIRSLHDSTQADLIGLSGIENIAVLEDLINHHSLIKSKYRYVFLKGKKGETGLGMAFIYNPKKLEFVWDTSFNLTGVLKPGQVPIRDGMHAKFKSKKIILDFIMVSLPNILDKPSDLASYLHMNSFSMINNYLSANNLHKNPTTIILGSINASLKPAIPLALLFGESPTSHNYEYATFALLTKFINSDSVGTFYKERVPYLFDHVIIAKKLYSNYSGWEYLANSITVHNPIWMQHPRFGKEGHPFNNFFKDLWIEGYSSYFPISFTLVYAKKRKKVN